MNSTKQTNRYSPYLSIVIPFYNEEESVEKLIYQILEVGEQFDFTYEIILVDDGSTDKTWQKIEHLKKSTANLKGIKLRKNFGQTNAMVAGFHNALGEIIITMDGDLQNDPSDIPRLLIKLEEGYDLVCGWRKHRKDKFWTRRVPSVVANWLIAKITGVPIHDSGCTLKAYRSSLIKSVRLYSDMHRFIPAVASIARARIAEIVVNHRPRKYGDTKYSLSRVWRVLFDIITINMLVHFHEGPMLWFAFFGFIFGLIGLGLGIASVLLFLKGVRTIIYPVASSLFLFLFGSLLSWGLLAEFFVKIERR
jgi:glycosyltransferase involved in cell wall biosynthesis